MDWCRSLSNVIHIFSNSITIWQNWVIYKLSYMPVQSLESIVCWYYGVDSAEQVIRGSGYL
tara:strand:- start:1488 stop:1670 length:183 start_codon:yes stop_codon:yes gene_type:complete